MAKDSEKRFHYIMDKLFQNPKSTPSASSSCPGVESRRGTKRPNSESALALVEPKAIANVMEKYQHSSLSAGSSQAPLCRPWDRGDLMRRLATFKSMTWFAKPKAVSAVNCARRGWVNVDTDTIACESCGSRLLFSTPSSWPKHQVEKAALVFSLKLDNGHKLLCAWTDNICDETLAQFPPATPPVLVDKFRERSSALLQLFALPVISPSAIECMRSSQLEEFLRWSSILGQGIESTKDSQTDCLGNECVDNSAKLYYQAQKLISLCGWEPRLLPYVIDCEYGVNQNVKDVDGLNPSINVDAAVSNEMVEVTENSGAHKSVVLDCWLCGASVGLWAFLTVARPVEFFRIVGYTELNGENSSGTHGSGNENHVDGREATTNTASNGDKGSSSNLNLTIAGGPPPTKQNFKAIISLPLIGRTLRAKFSYDLDFRDCRFGNQEEIQCGAGNKNLLQEGKDHTERNVAGQAVQAEDMGLLKRKQQDQGSDISITDDQFPCLNTSEKDDTLGKENNDHMPVEGTSVTGQDIFSETGTHCTNIQNSTETADIVKVGQSQNNLLPENPENAVDVDSALGRCGHLEVADSSITTPDANLIIGNGECSKNERSLVITSYNPVIAGSTGMDPKQLRKENAMKFDPIRQHRHFCPWISSTGTGSPGWQQTLSALFRQRERSHSSPTYSPPSSSIIKVDNPIASVRKLFMSPVQKRMKPTHEST